MGRRSDEIQNYIAQLKERREKTGILDFDTCQDILKYAADVNSDAVSGMGYYCFAEYYWKSGDHEKVMYCLSECIRCFLAENMYEFLARSYNMMGAVSDSQDNRVVALNYFHIGLQYAENNNLIYERAMLDSNIAYILSKMKQYKDAAESYERAIQGYEDSDDTI